MLLKKIILPAVLFSGIFLLASCGSGGGSNPPSPAPSSKLASAANLGDVSVGCGAVDCSAMALQWTIENGQTVDSITYRIYAEPNRTIQNGTITTGNNTSGMIISPQNSSVLLGVKNQTYAVDLTTHKAGLSDNTTPGIIIMNAVDN